MLQIGYKVIIVLIRSWLKDMIISTVIDSFVSITDVNEYNAAKKTKSA